MVIAETSTKNNSKKASMMDAPAVDPHAARFVFESIILARESVPCPVALAAGCVGIARFGRYKAKKSLVISIAASSRLRSYHSKVRVDNIGPNLPAFTVFLIGPSVAVASAKACQSSMKATTAKLVGFDNWQFRSTGRNNPASTIFCPGLFDADASQTFDHNDFNSGYSLDILDTYGQSDRKIPLASPVWPNLALILLTFEATCFLDAESAASFVRFDRYN